MSSLSRPSTTATDTDRRLHYVERFISGCPDRYLVTLTTRRRLDPISMSVEVSKVLHRVNGQLFGTAYKRGDQNQMRLATMAVQERTFEDGLHTHILVGVPEDSLKLKAHPCRMPVPELIVKEWIAQDPQGRNAKGQDARELYDFSGARSYIYKDIRSLSDIDNLDVDNTRIPII